MRILVAEDFAAWRSKLREMMDHTNWDIIGEACDGLDAAEKADQLRPDIVILDLSMPRMNGIEAGKLIRQRSPSTRIVFLSEDLDTDIQQAALSIGHAYVSKSCATTDLLPALERVQAAAASDREESGSLSSRS